MIASSTELRERERTKQAAITAAIREALEGRGTPRELAKPAAQAATVIFGDAFDRWIDSAGAHDFPTCLTAATAAFREACG